MQCLPTACCIRCPLCHHLYASAIHFDTSYWIARLGVAIRYGEAKNPGPPGNWDESISFCITNPTSLVNKSDTYAELMQSHQCDVVTCSETSATAKTQWHFASAMRKLKKKTQWSPAVPSLRATVTGQLDTRGQASGVAIISGLNIRPARLTLPESWATTTRFLHSILQVGETHVQIIVLYCRPTCNQQNVAYNQELMQMALEQAKQVPLPLMIMGDLNASPESLSCWPQLRAEGFQHHADLHEKIFSLPMKPSCKDVTNPDTAIICPLLAKMVVDIEVLSSEWFATHRPVIFRLKLPKGRLFKTRLRFPRSLHELGLSQDEINLSAERICATAAPESLEQWGKLVEDVFDDAVSRCHPSLKALPKSFRGRCQDGGIVKCPINSSVRKARDGDFEPHTEVLTMKTRRLVKQLRRLDSFFHRVKKFESQGPTTVRTFSELKLEWKAIRNSHVFGMPFLHWTQTLMELNLPEWPLPSSMWVNDARQHVKLTVEHALHMDAKLLRDKNRYHQELDKENHNKRAFSRVRGPGNPPITEIGSCVNFEAIVVATDCPHTWDVFAEPCDIQSLVFDMPVAVGTHKGTLIRKDMHYAVIKVCDVMDAVQESMPICQHQFAIDPQTIALKLNEFWLPIWQRDQFDLDFVDDPFGDDGFGQILAQVPALPQINMNMLDVDYWEKAISKLKTHSARGCDKISAQELKMLPRSLIELLAKVMSSYCRGFPEVFMKGLTAPLAKTLHIPGNHQTRPITILPQLYRLWSHVACAQISEVLCRKITGDVTGFLKNRGSADTAYCFQFHLENAKCDGTALSGITLDLIKCFNNVKWKFGYHMLLHLGVPITIAKQWMLSIGRMQRLWLIQGEVLPAGGSSTGFPEGDAWSVLVMIGIANAWCHFVRSRYTGSDLVLSAYADNWAWILQQQQGHTPVFQATAELTSLAGLTIDMSKTWFWCNHVSDINLIKEQLTRLPNGNKIQHKSSASDLGHQLHYSVGNSNGVINERLSKGETRLLRLKYMKHSLEVKEQILRMSVLPATFYGCTIKPPAQDAIEHIRSLAAHALLGSCSNLNPSVVLFCAIGGVLDPEFWIYVQVLRAARMFLLKCNPETRRRFLHIASRFHGHLSHVRGPASCLAHCLHKLDWKINDKGEIQVTAFLTFNLMFCSFKRFVRFMTRAWQEKFFMLHSHRTKWFNMPDVCQQETTAVLKTFPHDQRAALMRELGGGFQLAQQKMKWDSNQTDKCTFCEATDSREHRLLHCPVGMHVRQPYTCLLQELEECGSLIQQYPFAVVHPSFEAMQTILFNAPDPVWGVEICQHVRSMIARQVQVHWFTDGSCFHPASPVSRYSAYAIVLDLCENDVQRIHAAEAYANSNMTCPCLQIATVARTQGEQDILRAEMQAVAAIMLQFGEGVIHTDSQSTIDYMCLALSANTPWEFAACEHMDILYKVWSHKQHVHNTLAKVKAHVDVNQVQEPLTKYWSMGNALVNDSAKNACQYLHTPLVKELEALHLDTMQARKQLRGVFSLHLELQTVRAIAEAENKGDSARARHTQDDIVDAFSNWSVTPCRFVLQQHDERFLEHSSFGHDLAVSTLRWIRLLRWPIEDDNTQGPLGFQSGVSWLELGLSWMIFHSSYLPIIRADDNGVKRLTLPQSYDDAKDMNFTLSEGGTMIQKMLDNIDALLPEQLLFSFPRGKVSSSYNMGYKSFVQGLKVRPQFPHQELVVRELMRLLGTAASPYQATPKIDTLVGRRRQFTGTWQQRQDKAKLRMISVRKVRRGSH